MLVSWPCLRSSFPREQIHPPCLARVSLVLLSQYWFGCPLIISKQPLCSPLLGEKVLASWPSFFLASDFLSMWASFPIYFYFASEEETQAGDGCCLTSEPLPVLSSRLLVPFSPPLPSAGGAHRPLSSVANHYFFKPWLQCLLYEASFDQPPHPGLQIK